MDMDIEDSLRRALRAEEPPPDFAQRVLAQVQAKGPARSPTGSLARWRVPVALAASLFVVAVTVGIVQQQREARRRHSAQQLAIALEITSSQLNQVQQRLNRNRNTENGI
jgi:anti-sigma-K factor RskA